MVSKTANNIEPVHVDGVVLFVMDECVSIEVQGQSIAGPLVVVMVDAVAVAMEVVVGSFLWLRLRVFIVDGVFVSGST